MSKKKIITIIVSLVILIVGGIGIYIATLYNEAEKMIDNSHQELERGTTSEKREVTVDPKEDSISVLFIGVDDGFSRQGSSSLADAIVLATFNKNDMSINLVSIPRDSYVDVPYQVEKDKINHVHAFMGIDGMIDTVEQLLDIPVDYYVRLDFNAFVKVVDTLGGITVDVPYNIVESNSLDERDSIYLYEGRHRLNGEEALALARTRKYDSDLERGKRQMDIMQAILDQTLSFSSVTKYHSLIQDIDNHLATNFTFNEIFSLHEYVTKNRGLNIETHQLQGSSLIHNDIYYLELDEESVTEIQKELKKHLDLPVSIADNSKRDSTSY